MQNLNERIYFLDAMRGILMMLGVVLHSAQVFNVEKSWAIYSNDSATIASYLIDIIHAFRMPAFFIVSGYFCLLTIKRYGPNKFFKVRIKRIIIPLVITGLTLNTLQAIILSNSGWRDFSLVQQFLEGGWVSHLWFLINLVIYFSVAFLCALTISKQINWLNTIFTRLASKIPFFVLLIILPLSWIMIKISAKFGIPLYTSIGGVIDIYEIIFYLPYFIFGLWLRENPEKLFKFANINAILSISIIAVALFASSKLDASAGISQAITIQYLKVLVIWFSTSLCFHIFMKYANTHSPAFMFLSDASYSVYLFHHVFVISIGLFLIQVGLGGFTGLMTLIISITLITFVIHKYIISKFSILRYLYNGK